MYNPISPDAIHLRRLEASPIPAVYWRFPPHPLRFAHSFFTPHATSFTAGIGEASKRLELHLIGEASKRWGM